MNIKRDYCNTAHVGLRMRLIYENKNISQRLSEIFSIALFLKDRTNEKISYSALLLEKCERTISLERMEWNLFFL